MSKQQAENLPKSFIWRRLHSLVGVFLVLFLIEHLLTNSQAALLPGDDGQGFRNSVNLIHSLPYLPAIEVALLAIPFIIHIIWGIQYLRTSRPNSMKSDGSKPSLGMYGRNHGYTWQRITSWILVIGVIAHVGHMRFYRFPSEAHGVDQEKEYFVNVTVDEGLYTLAPRLGVHLIDRDAVQSAEQRIKLQESFLPQIDRQDTQSYNRQRDKALQQKQSLDQSREWLAAVEYQEAGEGEVVAAASDFGTAVLLVVRDTFKSPLMMILYTLFVISACFHACNGLWTALITWGVAINPRAQNTALKFTHGLMGLLILFGLSAIWGTYWFNLYS